MSVLVCLAEHAPGPVSKEELLQTVWPDTFVGEGVLTRSIFELRRLFEDDAKVPRVIETIAKRGYRLVAPVVPVNGRTEIAAAASSAQASEASAVSAHFEWSKLKRPVLVLASAALLTIFLARIDGVRTRVVGATAPPIRSLAVLPLQNLSGDPGQEYFSDGMTEELITELSRISGLKVISRTSVMRYKKTDKTLPEIARELHVDAIVEGSVLRSGDRVRITAQLIQARTDANLWAETYDRNLQDTLAVQEAVASAIAGKMKASITRTALGHSKMPHPVNFKAHEAYLRGVEENIAGDELSNHVGKEEAAVDHHRQAIEFYRQAIREDAQYAPAYVALASVEDDEARKDSEANARKAMEIDPSLPGPHLILAAMEFVVDRNWADAERELQTAIQLNPNSAAAHHEYGLFLDTTGRPEEALKEFQTAQDLDPATDHLGGARYSRRQFDLVIESARGELGSSPELFTTDEAILHKILMVAYARTGRQKESIDEFRRGLICMGYKDMAEDLRRGYLRGGYEGALREWLKGLKSYPKFPFPWLETYVYTELGDRDRAFALLPKLSADVWNYAYSDVSGISQGDIYSEPALLTLRLEPMWDPLHFDPRFDELAHSIGLPH